jgi:uncharacterized SAM-binding protein YcdF (DUF218 family)
MDFFTASKLFGAIIAPGNFVILALIIGLALSTTRYRRTGWWITFVTAAALVVLLVFPVGAWVTSPLENRFPRPHLLRHVEGILVLSGGENPRLFGIRGTAATIFSEGRLVEAVDLARRFPQARIVFSGVEADVARAAFRQMRAPMNRFTFEKRARNTWENLLFSKNLIRPAPGETWLLVTDAVSIPRAMGIARQVGWNMVAWPVDYQTGAPGYQFWFQFADNVRALETAAHEWIGLVVYRLTGRSAAWFPSP